MPSTIKFYCEIKKLHIFVECYCNHCQESSIFNLKCLFDEIIENQQIAKELMQKLKKKSQKNRKLQLKHKHNDLLECDHYIYELTLLKSKLKMMKNSVLGNMQQLKRSRKISKKNF